MSGTVSPAPPASFRDFLRDAIVPPHLVPPRNHDTSHPTRNTLDYELTEANTDHQVTLTGVPADVVIINIDEVKSWENYFQAPYGRRCDYLIWDQHAHACLLLELKSGKIDNTYVHSQLRGGRAFADFLALLAFHHHPTWLGPKSCFGTTDPRFYYFLLRQRPMSGGHRASYKREFRNASSPEAMHTFEKQVIRYAELTKFFAA